MIRFRQLGYLKIFRTCEFNTKSFRAKIVKTVFSLGSNGYLNPEADVVDLSRVSVFIKILYTLRA